MGGGVGAGGITTSGSSTVSFGSDSTACSSGDSTSGITTGVGSGVGWFSITSADCAS